MTDRAGQAGPAQAAGQGRLAQLIATRGGLAPPEAPFVIEHREALIYMLCEAAELEHAIMCQYLFAAFSLKQSASEGLSDAELAAVTRWRKQISHVATQEMLHLALVHNLLSAIGAAPHLARPNLPAPASHYPAGVQLALLPFGEQALRHFMFLERPEGMDLADAEGLAAMNRAAAHRISERDIVPQGQDFATVGHLYRSVETGFRRLAGKYGEPWLFVGPPRAQATQQNFRWPELVAVTDLATAQQAIDTILEQGEGPRGHWQTAHFGQFVEILDEYEQLSQANPGFDPVRPVIAANVRPCEGPVQVPLITDPLTARITDLFNVAYEILLQMFERYFAHTEETDEQLATLADATIGLMLRVIKPLGDLITTRPAGPEHPGRTAGPSFELFYETDYLMPHRQAAWALLTERLNEATWLCEELRAGRGAALAAELAPVGTALAGLAQSLAAHLPADSPQARRAAQAGPPDPAARRAALDRADELAAAVAAAPSGAPLAGQLSALFGLAHTALRVTAGAGRRPGVATGPTDAASRLVNSVLRPLADAVATAARQPGQPAQQVPDQEAAPPGDPVWQAAQEATALRAVLGRGCPAGLAEATAALQALACDLADGAEAASRLSRLRDLQADLPASIQTAPNGPYLLTNVATVRNHLGLPVPVTPQTALCRCGGSARKPFCDGSHASNGFTDEKDPKRVPDRRAAYPGEQVTVLDNRGLCQHSGLCTDRLPTAFRTSQEPFVAASGGRLDEIIRAVRDCPSGALGLAFDGREQPALRDWAGTREPAVEITQDGPYRVTGGIELTAAGGGEVTRNQGASHEHYALCRCGHSQNKPFCSGMHWYVDFRDPPRPADPTLFEWAGGLPALTRMTRLLYEKYVPADPVLAAAFAGMPPGHPGEEAAALAEALGGPAWTPPADGYPRLLGRGAARELTEEQRARWVTLAGQAAQDAGLPAEPQFQAAFTGYLEWSSRSAVAQPAGPPADPGQPAAWDWTPAGRPPAEPAADAAAGQQAQGQPVPLPGPDEEVSFAAHIKPLFRARDQKSMSFAFDLWSADDVQAHAADILDRLRNGSMPCDTAWPSEQVAVFQRWTETGFRP